MLSQHVAVGRRAGKGPAETNAFRIWPPENETDIKTTRNRPIEYIEQGAAAVRHDKIGRAKGDCQPDAILRSLNRLADTPKRRNAVDQRLNRISIADRIRARRWPRDTHREDLFSFR